MRIGDRGDRVKEVQNLLLKKNYIVVADGFFGIKTQTAVKAFQAKEGLDPDGIVGPLTYSRLNDKKIETITSKVFEVGESSTLDSRTLKVLSTLDPKAILLFQKFIEEAKTIAASFGYTYIALSGHRDKEEQNALYEIGRSKPGKIVTNARFGYSNHNFKTALDFGVFKNGKYLDETHPAESEKVHRAVSKIASKYGLDWGGNWKGKFQDYPHFEVHTDLSFEQKRMLFEKHGSIL